MPEPCRSCPEHTVDLGGCRCQAFLLTGDATVTDPVCDKSPHHGIVRAAVAEVGPSASAPLAFRTPENSRALHGGDPTAGGC